MVSCRILVVDDDPSIRRTVSEALQFEGYQVDMASNGMQALDLLDVVHPAIVVLDMRMPGLDGWAFAERARARGNCPMILVMTAAQNARLWAAEIGAEDFLAKPFDLDQLIATIERLCRGAAARNAA
jgi:two-component system response regulator MprA